MSDENNPFFLMGAMLGEKSGEVTDLRRRIEELEANLAEQIEWVKCLADDLIAAEGREARLKEKLAKLERAAKPFAVIKIKDGMSQPGEIGRTDVTNIRAALAELTGGKDE